jgi:hypothetical protein
MKKVYLTISLITTLIFLFIFLLKFNSSRNSVDYLNQSLSSVKKKLTNHSKISLIASEDNYLELYYQTQFSLVPNIVEKKEIDNDTIIVIERHKTKKTDFIFSNYTIIQSDSNSMFYVTLCSKKQ